MNEQKSIERDIHYCNKKDMFEGSKGFTYVLKEGDVADKDYIETIRSFVENLYNEEKTLEAGQEFEVFVKASVPGIEEGIAYGFSEKLNKNPAYITLVSDGVDIELPIDKIEKIEVKKI